jgi:hypothetical protein
MTYPNWFQQTASINFKTYLKEFAGEPNLRFLQIGAFTGDASVWMCENILTDDTSLLIDIDTWKGSDEEVHHAMDFDDVLKVYEAKTKPYKTVAHFRMTSSKYFTEYNELTYDFIYIDGDHTASGVIDDAIMSWQVLKPGGIMAFDDYIWMHPDGDIAIPRPSINFFLWAKQGQLDMLEVNNQVWLRKKQ